MKNKYKLRAECLADLVNFLKLTGSIKMGLVIELDNKFPDCICTLETSARLDTIKKILEEVPDGHVMIQTLSKESLYTGTR